MSAHEWPRDVSTDVPRGLEEENLWLKAALVCVLKQQCGDHLMPPSIFDREVDRLQDGSTRLEVFWDWGLFPPARVRIEHENCGHKEES
jgi:hypothetical protein